MGYSRLPVNPRCHSRFKAIPDHPQLRFRRFDLLFAANNANSAGKKKVASTLLLSPFSAAVF